MSYHQAVVSTCGTCPTCCSITVTKRSSERVPICLSWAHRLDCGGPWILKRVHHVVKQATGASLTYPAYDPAATYPADVLVAVGSATYKSSGPALPGQSPWSNPALWVPQMVTKVDAYVPVDTDRKPLEWVSAGPVQTTALLEAGVADTDYRVEAMATFRHCDGHEIHLWDCVTVKIADC